MSRENLERFQEIILNNTVLQERLKATPDKDSFVRLACQMGEESGYNFTAEEVEEVIRQAGQRLESEPQKFWPLFASKETELSLQREAVEETLSNRTLTRRLWRGD